MDEAKLRFEEIIKNNREKTRTWIEKLKATQAKNAETDNQDKQE